MIEFSGSGTKYIKWTAPSGVVGLTSKSVLIWYYHVGNLNSGTVYTINDGSGSDSDEYNLFVQPAGANTTFDYLAAFSGTDGVWRITTGFLTTSTLFHIAVTYNGSATTNDPVFYVNGSSVSLTELSTPTGTINTGTSTDLYLGSNGIVSTVNPNGRVLSFCIYNRILSASEITDAFNSKLAIPTWRGLVFAPQLWQRGEVGEGGTLTSSHTIADAVSGALGTPSGSPLHKQDTYLRME